MILNIKYIIFIIFSLICLDVRAYLFANPLRITQEQKEYSLDSYVFFYEDTESVYSIDTIITPENALLFSPSKNNGINGGYSKSTYWTRIILHNTRTTPIALSLSEHYPHLTNLSFYLIKNGRILNTMHTGEKIPISKRTVIAPSFVFPFELSPGISTLYVKGTSRGSLTFEYTLFNQKIQYEMITNQQAIYSTILGIMAMSIFLSCMFSIALKEKSYIYLAMVNVASFFFITTFLGLQPFYLPISIRLQFPFLSIPFFSALFIIFMAQFTLIFLSITKEERILYAILTWIRNTIVVMAIITIFLPYQYALQTLLPYSIILIIFICIGINRVIQKNRNAIFYTAGFFILFTIVGIRAFERIGIIREHIPTNYGMPIGIIIQTLLMQIAIATNVFRLYKKQISLQQDLLKTQENTIKEQKILTNSYSRFVPHDFIQMLGKDNILDVDVGHYNQDKMFILFTDIRNFSTISYDISPDKMFELTNTLFSFITPCVYDCGGIIDKYTGDGILAIYPIASSSNVIQSSIRMQQAVKQTAQQVKHITNHEIQMGIGINSGMVILGMVGDKSRIDATVISSVVNESAKIEKLNKKFGTNTLIAEDTYNQIEITDNFFIRSLRKTHAVREHPIRLYEVFDSDSDEQKEQKLSTKPMFQEAMLLLDENKTDKSITLLEKCVRQAPLDIPAQHILRNIKRLDII